MIAAMIAAISASRAAVYKNTLGLYQMVKI
jgi:hypothetical protein